MKKLILYTFLIILGVLLGILAERNKQYLINGEYIKNHWSNRKLIDDKSSIINSDNTIIFLAFGQSNSANYGSGSYACRNKEIYNYCKGNLYVAKEPLLGADGTSTSVWTRVADLLLDSGLCKKVIIIPCGIGQTSVDCWANGACKVKLDETLNYLKKDHIKLTHIFWDQGETDNVDGTTKIQYQERLKKIIKSIRDQGFNAPFYSTITSYCPFENNNPFGIDTAITGAQNEIIRTVKNVRRGPNTDSLNLAYYRYDILHFTEEGLDKLAYGWFEKLQTDFLNR